MVLIRTLSVRVSDSGLSFSMTHCARSLDAFPKSAVPRLSRRLCWLLGSYHERTRVGRLVAIWVLAEPVASKLAEPGLV
jgi:hypothetical protein